MFFTRYNEISANLSKTFRSKKNLTEAASQFSELASSLDSKNSFEYHLIGLARFGEMRCYEKLEDISKFINTSILAARFFVKSAKFNYEISPTIRDPWIDPLSNGIHCYKSAISVLKSTKKYNLAVLLLNELGSVERHFNYFHNAGNEYEEAVRISTDRSLGVRIFSKSLFNCIECYASCERFDLALILSVGVTAKIESDYIDSENKSPIIQAKVKELNIINDLLFICDEKYQNAIKTIHLHKYEKNISDILEKLIDLCQNKCIDQVQSMIDEFKTNKIFSETFVIVLEKRCQAMRKTQS